MKTIDKQRQILYAIEDNWDTYGSDAPNELAIENALTHFDLFERYSEYTIGPTCEGGVSVFFSFGVATNIELAFDNDGQIWAITMDEGVPDVWKMTLDEVPTALANFTMNKEKLMADILVLKLITGEEVIATVEEALDEGEHVYILHKPMVLVDNGNRVGLMFLVPDYIKHTDKITVRIDHTMYPLVPTKELKDKYRRISKAVQRDNGRLIY